MRIADLEVAIGNRIGNKPFGARSRPFASVSPSQYPGVCYFDSVPSPFCGVYTYAMRSESQLIRDTQDRACGRLRLCSRDRFLYREDDRSMQNTQRLVDLGVWIRVWTRSTQFGVGMRIPTIPSVNLRQPPNALWSRCHDWVQHIHSQLFTGTLDSFNRSPGYRD